MTTPDQPTQSPIHHSKQGATTMTATINHTAERDRSYDVRRQITGGSRDFGPGFASEVYLVALRDTHNVSEGEIVRLVSTSNAGFSGITACGRMDHRDELLHLGSLGAFALARPCHVCGTQTTGIETTVHEGDVESGPFAVDRPTCQPCAEKLDAEAEAYEAGYEAMMEHRHGVHSPVGPRVEAAHSDELLEGDCDDCEAEILHVRLSIDVVGTRAQLRAYLAELLQDDVMDPAGEYVGHNHEATVEVVQVMTNECHGCGAPINEGDAFDANFSGSPLRTVSVYCDACG
jgi:hypothetical protein